MRKIAIQAKSKKHSQKALWKRVANLEKYPKQVKYCKAIFITEIKEGAVFHDITTLLWIPLKIKHIILKLDPYKEIKFLLPLPGGGKMWHTFMFKQEAKHARVNIEMAFDLGNRIFNATVGHIIEKRLVALLKHGLSGFEEIKRI